MTIAPYGDSALLINFEQEIDEQINANVVALSNEIRLTLVESVTFCIPAFCSITVGFNAAKIQFENLVDQINTLYSNLGDIRAKIKTRKINIPVCYQGDYAIDKIDIVRQTGLSWEDIVELHTSVEYRVYMLGFIAGFAYMGTLPKSLACSRKESPRLNIPSGTVGIAGLQTGIYPTRAHAGWQLIGRTPVPIFNINTGTPFLLQSGDRVTFHMIEPEAYETIRTEVESGKFDFNSVVANE